MNQEEVTYSQEVTKALNIAQKIGRENLNASYTGAHLLKAMLNRDLSLLKQLENLGVDVYYLEEWAEVRIEELPKSPNKYSCEPDEIIDEIFAEADSVRELLEEEEISLFAVMVLADTVQYKETDYQFIRRLAIRHGEFFYYNGQQLTFGTGVQGNDEEMSEKVNMDYFSVRINELPHFAKNDVKLLYKKIRENFLTLSL